MSKSLILGDLHFPFVDRKALDLVLLATGGTPFDRIILNGDLPDCFAPSKFIKLPKHAIAHRLPEEFDQVSKFLGTLRKIWPDAEIDWIFGNHEYRLDSFIASRCPELAGLRGLSVAEQCDAAQHKVRVIYSETKESCQLYGKVLVGHFDKVCAISGATAHNLLQAKAISLITGHTHRLGSSHRRLFDRDIVAYENGCLCDRDPLYANHPNWQLGFSVLHKDDGSDFFYVEQHPLAEVSHARKKTYKLFWEGKIYVN